MQQHETATADIAATGISDRFGIADRDSGIYGIAALDCLTGHVEDSLRRLDESLKLNPQLRYQARNDSDFHNLAEDPRFTELLYPDPGADLDSPDAGFSEDEPV